jgi:hypothetical protein
MKVTRNVGMLDRIVRIALGIGMIVAGATVARGTASTVLYVLSVPLIVSAVLGFCPSYTLLGISTRKERGCC